MKIKLSKNEKLDAIEDIIWSLEDYIFNMTCAMKDEVVEYEKYDEQIKRDVKTAVWAIKNIIMDK